MKRKLFSAILFGALLTASTSGLTSCKDYDDDISNLQSQIDKLATKEELATKASELSTAISNAQQAAQAASDVAKDAAAAAKAAATKDDVEAAKKAAIEAGQTAADKALKAANDAQAAADKNAEDLKKAADGAQKAVEKIQTAMEGLATTEAVTAAVKEVADKYDAQEKELKALSDRLDKVEAKLGLGEGGEDIDLTEIQAELEDIEDAFEALVGVVSNMVTSVELVYRTDHYGSYDYSVPGGVNRNDLKFQMVTEKANNSFGKDVATEVLTTAKDQTKYYGDEIYVRVNPVDAVFSKEDISLINSKGEELNGLVEVLDIKPFTGFWDNPLTRASTERTGLYAIKVAPVAGTKAADLNKKFSTTPATPTSSFNHIVYAVAVKSAISDSIETNRRVVSEYDLTMELTPYSAKLSDVTGHSTNLVDIKLKTSTTDESVKNIYNRYGLYGGTELVWQSNTADTKITYNNANPPVPTNASAGDNRNSLTKRVVARVGEDIKIKFTEDIKGFYVTLDYPFVETTSAPSEVNAWNSYQYENVGKTGVAATMFKGNEGTIKVSALSGQATGDEIGFRIFAMNLDGTLVDPDGVAFYVSVGEVAGDDINLTAQNILVTKAVGSQGFNTTPATAAGNLSGEVALPSNAFANFTLGTVSCVNTADSNDKPTAANYQVLYKVGSNWQGAFAANATAIKVQILDATAFKDGGTYTITLPLQKTANGQAYTVKNAVINITKDMPTSCPSFIWKTNQTELQALVPAGGNYTAAPGTKRDGILDFNNMFVVADGSQIKADQSYVFKLASSAKNNNNKVALITEWQKYYADYQGAPQTATTEYQTLIANEFIDCTTPHALTTEYNYGNISNDNNKNPYKLSTSNYNLTYTTWSIQSSDYMTYAWKKVNIGTTQAPNYQPKNFINTAAATPTMIIDNVASTPGQMIYGDLRQADLKTYVVTKSYLYIKEVHTKSSVNGIVDEYYTASVSGNTITFTLRNTGATVPNHTAEVQIKVVDCFGHAEVIKLSAEFKATSTSDPQLASI